MVRVDGVLHYESEVILPSLWLNPPKSELHLRMSEDLQRSSMLSKTHTNTIVKLPVMLHCFHTQAIMYWAVILKTS